MRLESAERVVVGRLPAVLAGTQGLATCTSASGSTSRPLSVCELHASWADDAGGASGSAWRRALTAPGLSPLVAMLASSALVSITSLRNAKALPRFPLGPLDDPDLGPSVQLFVVLEALARARREWSDACALADSIDQAEADEIDNARKAVQDAYRRWFEISQHAHALAEQRCMPASTISS
jgi:hypothetical protein